MKKIFSLMAAVALMLTLSACKDADDCDPIIKEVPKEVIVEKEVIKEIPVVVEKEVPYEVDTTRAYKPGTYFKASEADENGIVTYAVVSIDAYGEIAGVYTDNTTTEGKYLFDEETGILYVFVPGVKDVIPDTYRRVTPGDRKVATDAITTEDLIVGFPDYDAIIATLTEIDVNETQRVLDDNASGNTWSRQMNAVAAKIVADQTTYGINLYNAGDTKLTNSIANVDLPIEAELLLIQSILDNEAELEANTVLVPTTEGKAGLYTTGTHFATTMAVNDERNGIIYNTSVTFVDQFGRITGIFLDETFGKSTKKILGDEYGMKEASEVGKEWDEQIMLLEEAIVANQGTGGFKYAEFGTDKVAIPSFELKANSSEYKNSVEITNVAGVTIAVNGLIAAANESTGDVELELEAGTYYNTDEFGNIMQLTVAVVATKAIDVSAFPAEGGTADSIFEGADIAKGDIITHAGNVTAALGLGLAEYQIVSMTLDTVYAQEQAYITVDGEDFPLYTYEKGYLDIATDVVKEQVLVYQDGDTYRYARTITLNGEEFEIEDAVRFDFDGFDEEATLVAVEANSTKVALKDYYGMTTDPDSNGLEFYEQALAYTKAFIGQSTPYVLNMMGDKTDSITGVTMAVAEYNDLLVDTLRMAQDSANSALYSANNKDGNIYDVSGFDLGDDLTGGTVDGEFALANGYYVATSDVPTKDGGFYTMTMTVVNNKPYTISFDETIVLNDEITTKVNLGDDYKVKLNRDNEYEVSTAKDAVTYATVIGTLLEGLEDDVVDNLDANLLNGYDYELDTRFEEEETFFKKEQNVSVYDNAAQKNLLESLQARVPEVMYQQAKKLADLTTAKDKFIVASEGNVTAPATPANVPAGYLATGVGNQAPIGNGEVVDIEIESVSRFADVEESSNQYYLVAEADDVPASTLGQFSYLIEYDDYEVKTKEFNIPIKSNHDFKQTYLSGKNTENDKDRLENLNKDFENFISGDTVELDGENPLSGNAYDINRLGTGVAYTELYWQVNATEDTVVHYVVAAATVTGTDGAELTLGINNLGQVIVTPTAVSTNIAADETVTFVIEGVNHVYTFRTENNVPASPTTPNPIVLTNANIKDVTIGSNPTVVFDATPTGDDLLVQDHLKDVFTLAKNTVVTDAANKTVTVVTIGDEPEDVIGSVTFRGFFDAFDQDDEQLETYQRGEANRDFTFNVYGSDAAIKYAKSKTRVGNYRDNVSVSQEIDLVDTKDIKITNLATLWDGSENLDGTNALANPMLPKYLEAKIALVGTNGVISDYKDVLLYDLNEGTGAADLDTVYIKNGVKFGTTTLTDISADTELGYSAGKYLIKVGSVVFDGQTTDQTLAELNALLLQNALVNEDGTTTGTPTVDTSVEYHNNVVNYLTNNENTAQTAYDATTDWKLFVSVDNLSSTRVYLDVEHSGTLVTAETQRFEVNILQNTVTSIQDQVSNLLKGTLKLDTYVDSAGVKGVMLNNSAVSNATTFPTTIDAETGIPGAHVVGDTASQDLPVKWFDNNGKELAANAIISTSIQAQTASMKSGELRPIKFSAEVTFEINGDGVERTLTYTYEAIAYKN